MKRCFAVLLALALTLSLSACRAPEQAEKQDKIEQTEAQKYAPEHGETVANDEPTCDLPNEDFRMEVLDGKLRFSLIMAWPEVSAGRADDEYGKTLFRLLNGAEALAGEPDCIADHTLVLAGKSGTGGHSEYALLTHGACGTVQVRRDGAFLCAVRLAQDELAELLALSEPMAQPQS